MSIPVGIVGYLALFTSVGIIFLFANLLVGRFLRPKLPNPEKLEIYECGEPTIGSSFVQFDLRFYVVALLFIIFDVEVAFFFPWATVFGKATQLVVAAQTVERDTPANQLSPTSTALYQELGVPKPTVPTLSEDARKTLPTSATPVEVKSAAIEQSARRLALISIADIGVFFAVLLVGFAYVWKRGDLDWVRAVSQQRSGAEAAKPMPPANPPRSPAISA